MNKIKLFIYILIVLLFNRFIATGQERTIEDIETALTLKLCNYITWPVDTNQTYVIGIHSQNEKLSTTFKNISPKVKIHQKKINIVDIKNLSQIYGLQVLFIDKGSGTQLQKIIENISGKNILLFSVDYKASKDIMFNLLIEEMDGMVSFEFNRANLIFEGFEIDTEIIELKGSEIDIRELYHQTRIRLEKEEKKAIELNEQLKSQSQNIITQHDQIEKLNIDIYNKNQTIENQKIDIEKQKIILNELNGKFMKQEHEINEKRLLLSRLQGDLISVNKSLQLQRKRIDNQLIMLDSLNKSIEKKQKIIEEKQKDIAGKDIILQKKENMITFRNRMIFLLFFMSGVAFSLLFLVFKTNRENVKAKRILALQKEELEITLDKLKLAQNQLIQSEKMASLGILIAGIAHEINNPVNFISSGLQGLERFKEDILLILNKYRSKYASTENNKEIDHLENELDVNFLISSSDKIISNMKTGIDRTVNIIKSLKLFSHENDRPEKINIHNNIDLALTILSNQYKYHVKIEKEYGEIPMIECYPGKMNQVFVNLLSNAIQSINKKGLIKIKTMLSNQFVHISVIDNGSGIHEEIKHKIFDPFFTTKEVGKGTGLGLSIVYNIIQEHKGEIEFNSQEHEGTEFIIKLPLTLT